MISLISEIHEKAKKQLPPRQTEKLQQIKETAEKYTRFLTVKELCE
jgi:hypothetical protein